MKILGNAIILLGTVHFLIGAAGYLLSSISISHSTMSAISMFAIIFVGVGSNIKKDRRL